MTSTPAEQSLIREAAEWRLIELLFACPSKSNLEQIRALAAEVQDEDLRDAARTAADEASEGVYHSIFGPGGPAPGREASYQGTLQLGHLISELKAYYDAFAYTPTSSEPLDHVSVEAGFLGFLRLKQAFAVSRAADEEAEVTARAVEDFLRTHLSHIAEPLSTALDWSGSSYLALVGRALLRRVGPRPKQMFDILDQAAGESDAGAFPCGEA